MKLVRSWPAVIPEGRSYVVDDIPRFIMGGEGQRQFDYRGLADLDDDVVLIEWDIAIGGRELFMFMARAKAEPEQVRVAPYLLYRNGGQSGRPQVPFYVHRIRTRDKRSWATPVDTHCQMFGFGLVYLPKAMIQGFVRQMDPKSHFGDTEFSNWYRRNAPEHLRDVPIDWDCHAVHLHYLTPEVP